MNLKTALLALPVLVMAGCQSGPAEPPAGMAQAVDTCRDIAPGSGTYAPPFPAGCEGTQESEDGLIWLELTRGPEGRAAPEAGATVIVDYEGYLASDGTRIDSSFERGEPAVFKVEEVIEGWTRTLKRMTPGDEWLVYIPSNLAYGANPPGEGVPANADLVFRIRLQGYMNADAAAELKQTASADEALGAAPELWDEFLPWDSSREGVKTLESGLSWYQIDSPGEAGPTISADDMVAIDYEARLADTGRVVGTTWNQTKPLVVRAGDLIPGFAQTLTLMQPGDIVIAHMPSKIAYGEEGLDDAIPPDADLVYLVNLITLNPRTPSDTN
ncbi:FKBP-type peptidyl-prolyl cis-trans isomerase [Henriciella sp.]|uniref:FKBP-type peptidyl-prolyl cis-trans isomerase n=1 Tax=Henriciella sp. TaxID=1968823 RepID=UPI00261E02C2|nr:FKBP-type peptidyl-prolyl cis-trans isomerase [Henriciella sp.]